MKWNDEQKNKAEAENKRNPNPSQDEGEAKRQKTTPIFVIFVKFRGITDGEAHLTTVTQPIARIFEVHEEVEIREHHDMNFTRLDCKGISFPHSDPLAMVVEIAEQPIHIVLINTRADFNVIYKSCWDRMDVGSQHLVRATTPIVGF